MENDTKINALCDEAKAVGKQHALLRVQRYAVGLMNANKGDIILVLVMKNLLAAIDGYHREADAEFASASERFAAIVAAESEAANASA